MGSEVNTIQHPKGACSSYREPFRPTMKWEKYHMGTNTDTVLAFIGTELGQTNLNPKRTKELMSTKARKWVRHKEKHHRTKVRAEDMAQGLRADPAPAGDLSSAPSTHPG